MRLIVTPCAQGINVAINFSMLLGAALVLKQNKAQLGRTKGFIFLATYFVILTLFALTTFGTRLFDIMYSDSLAAL